MRIILIAITLIFLLIAFLIAFREAPPAEIPLGRVAQLYNRQTVAETSATNVIAAINFDWRAYDTLGEASILLTAATGVTALLRRYLHRRRETGIT
ncbi:MAG: hydrogen gas-evolving membrane-bound hydrogenase subunit E [Anaerolineae bacterium]